MLMNSYLPTPTQINNNFQTLQSPVFILPVCRLMRHFLMAVTWIFSIFNSKTVSYIFKNVLCQKKIQKSVKHESGSSGYSKGSKIQKCVSGILYKIFLCTIIILIPLVLSLNVDYNLMSLTRLLKVSVEWHGLEQFFYESY